MLDVFLLIFVADTKIIFHYDFAVPLKYKIQGPKLVLVVEPKHS